MAIYYCFKAGYTKVALDVVEAQYLQEINQQPTYYESHDYSDQFMLLCNLGIISTRCGKFDQSTFENHVKLCNIDKSIMRRYLVETYTFISWT